MKESFWAVLIVGLGITSIFLVYFFQTVTNTSEHNYELLKETTEAAMFDALDYSAYKKDETIRIDQERFVESFLRRFADNVDETRTYTIQFIDLNEVPPKVSVRINSNTVLEAQGESVSINTQLDQIVEANAVQDPYTKTHLKSNMLIK